MLPATRNFVVPGLLYLMLGVLCMALPQVAALAIGVLLGVGLLAAGVSSLVFAGTLVGWPGAGISFFSGLLTLASGVVVLLFPALGALSLTAILVVFFLLDGLLKSAIAWRAWGLPGSGWIALHGAASLLLAVLVLEGWPASADWVLGLFLGIHFMLKGWAWLIIGLGRPRVY